MDSRSIVSFPCSICESIILLRSSAGTEQIVRADSVTDCFAVRNDDDDDDDDDVTLLGHPNFCSDAIVS